MSSSVPSPSPVAPSSISSSPLSVVSSSISQSPSVSSPSTTSSTNNDLSQLISKVSKINETQNELVRDADFQRKYKLISLAVLVLAIIVFAIFILIKVIEVYVQYKDMISFIDTYKSASFGYSGFQVAWYYSYPGFPYSIFTPFVGNSLPQLPAAIVYSYYGPSNISDAFKNTSNASDNLDQLEGVAKGETNDDSAGENMTALDMICDAAWAQENNITTCESPCAPPSPNGIHQIIQGAVSGAMVGGPVAAMLGPPGWVVGGLAVAGSIGMSVWNNIDQQKSCNSSQTNCSDPSKCPNWI